MAAEPACPFCAPKQPSKVQRSGTTALGAEHALLFRALRWLLACVIACCCRGIASDSLRRRVLQRLHAGLRSEPDDLGWEVPRRRRLWMPAARVVDAATRSRSAVVLHGGRPRARRLGRSSSPAPGPQRRAVRSVGLDLSGRISGLAREGESRHLEDGARCPSSWLIAMLDPGAGHARSEDAVDERRDARVVHRECEPVGEVEACGDQPFTVLLLGACHGAVQVCADAAKLLPDDLLLFRVFVAVIGVGDAVSDAQDEGAGSAIEQLDRLLGVGRRVRCQDGWRGR